MKRRIFIGPLQGFNFGFTFFNQVAPTSCCDLKTVQTCFRVDQRSVGLLQQSNIAVDNLWTNTLGFLQQNVV